MFWSVLKTRVVYFVGDLLILLDLLRIKLDSHFFFECSEERENYVNDHNERKYSLGVLDPWYYHRVHSEYKVEGILEQTNEIDQADKNVPADLEFAIWTNDPLRCMLIKSLCFLLLVFFCDRFLFGLLDLYFLTIAQS